MGIERRGVEGPDHREAAIAGRSTCLGLGARGCGGGPVAHTPALSLCSCTSPRSKIEKAAVARNKTQIKTSKKSEKPLVEDRPLKAARSLNSKESALNSSAGIRTGTRPVPNASSFPVRREVGGKRDSSGRRLQVPHAGDKLTIALPKNKNHDLTVENGRMSWRGVRLRVCRGRLHRAGPRIR